MQQSSFMEADMGTKVFGNRLTKLGGLKNGERAQIAFLSRKVTIIKTHYDETLRYIYCNDGICCEKFGPPSVRYVFPVIWYATDKRGDIIKDSADWKAVPLVMGPREYDQIVLKDQLTGDIRKHDLMVVCQNEQYQNYSYETLGPCAWNSIPQIKGKIKEEVEYYKKHIQHSLAKSLTDQEIVNALSSAGAGAGGGRPLAFDQEVPASAALVSAPQPALPMAQAPQQYAPQQQAAPQQVPRIAPQQQAAPQQAVTPMEADINYEDLFSN